MWPIALALIVTAAAVAGNPPALVAVEHGSPTDAAFIVLVVCGWHPRERITRDLCERWNRLLETAPPTRVRVVVVADVNPEGNALTDERCWRGNARGVDLNRNWPPLDGCDDDGGGGVLEREWSHGDAPFSEWETRALDRITRDVAPDLVIAVHSGTLALLTPYDSCARTPANQPDLMRLGNWLRHGVCAECVLTRSHAALYASSGTFTDYAYHTLGVPFVYTLEMYAAAVDDLGDCDLAFSPAQRTLAYEEALRRWDALPLKLAHVDNDDFTTLLRMTGIYVPE